PIVIVLNNVSIHVNKEVTRVIEQASLLVRFLLLYLLDFNSIKLTFAILKS
ncbi:hypothetical protein BCR34DRAFT_495757, partial [Clohesyomyces aquaticus]